MRTSSLSEKPVRHHPRRLADWINPTGARKVHSLVDKVYKMKNLELAWQKVRKNRGAGGIDGESIETFEGNLAENLTKLHEELKADTYRPQPVRQKMIPKPGQPGHERPLGIPRMYDRVCQQALANRLEPIFEPVFDDATGTGRKDRQRMRCGRSGRRSKRVVSGSWTPISKIFLGRLIMRSSCSS